jgi:hypothetical protein
MSDINLKDKPVALDIRKGMHQFGDDARAYISILRSYSVNTKPLLDTMEKVCRDTLTDYLVAVHDVKDASERIFADEIANAADMLEQAAKDGDYFFVKEHNPPFVRMAKKLLEDLDRVLSETK